jgi:uncharacterized membrane protein
MSATAPEPSSDRGPLDRPATRGLVLHLAAEGLLEPAARDAALRIIRPERAWWLWIERLLLALGAALVVAGVVFFFAFNWAAIPPLAKLAIVQALVAGCAVAAWWTGLDTAVGRVLLLSASMLVGVLLAVFGQIYQTGADAYELFVGWAALVAGWVAISRFQGHWMLWIAVVDLAIGLYWGQVLVAREIVPWETGFLALAAVNGLALAVKEYAAPRVAWLAPRWARWVLWSSVLVFLTIPSVAFVVGELDTSIFSLLALVATLAGGYWYFRRRARDLLSITLGTLAACFVVLTAIGRQMVEDSFALLIYGVMVLVVFGAATFWLRLVGKAMDGERRYE